MPKRSQFDAMREAVLATKKIKVGGLIDKTIEKSAFAVITTLCVGVLMMMFLPHKNNEAKSIGIFHKETTNNELNQNLEILETLKQLKDEVVPKTNLSKKEPLPQINKERAEEKGEILSKELQIRMNAPMTLYAFQGEIKKQAVSQNPVKPQSLFREGSNSAFLNNKNDIAKVRASRLAHPDFMITSGEMIAATLETGINSELPGMVKAIVTRDVYSFTNNRLLIPKGSEAVGQFSAELKETQSRALIIWQRLLLPDGTIANINSPATDRLGGSGMEASSINHHFLERFSASSLLSVLGVYGEVSNDLNNAQPSYLNLLKQRFNQEFSQDLARHIDIKPTLTIHQGAAIHIFVAQDIDFYGVLHGSD